MCDSAANFMADEQNLNIKINPPEKAIWALVAILAVFSVFGVVAIINGIKAGNYIGKSMDYQQTINITGEGKIFAKPDIGQIDLSVVSQGNAVSAVVTDNNQKMNKITQAMKDLGIKDEDLKTTNYNINPNYQYSGGKSTIAGYEVTQTLKVKIRDLNKTSQILEKAASLGANQAGSLSFTIDDPEKIKEEAREKAIVNAKDKAGAMAKILGISLGKIVGFSESSSGEPNPIYYGTDGKGGGGATAVPAPEVSTGQNEIIIDVSLTYEVK